MSEHNLNPTITNSPACDVVVVGGGIAGTYAALAAARQGVDTVLIEQHGFVGGQGTAGGVHTFCGETRLVNDAWRDMIARLAQFGGIAAYCPNHDGRKFGTEFLKFVLQEMLREAGVRLLLHTQLVEVERDGDATTALIIFNKSGLQRLGCKMVVDASGDADVVARGRWPTEKGGPVFMPGDEAKIDESAGRLQLPMSLYFTLVEEDEPVTPFRPTHAPRFRGDDDLPMLTLHDHHHLIVAKMKVIGHDATDGESLSNAEQDSRLQMMGVIYHLQTMGYKGRVYDHFRLAWVAPHIGIREGRRILARYHLTADDVMSGRHFDDAVAVGSYHVDYHWPTIVQRAGTGLTSQCPPYQIPLRAMRPLGSDNLLVPGRSLSGEQMAMSSFRVMGTCAQTGFAAGTAAATAVVRGERLDDVPIADIQARLRSSGVRLDLAPYTNYLRVRRRTDEAIFETTDLFQECHASTVVVLPDGDVVCAWFAGTTEGADDVAIWCAIRHEEHWSEPRELVRVPGIPTWNPVLFLPDTTRLFAETRTEETDAQPRLLLYYRVGKKITEWRSFVIESRDGGHSWSEPQPLPDGILGPIKNKPIVLSDGTWLSGSSVETDDEWYSQIEHSADEGQSWSSVTLKLPGHPKGIIQPTLWESQPGHVHALMRSRGVGRIVRADSVDGGLTWNTPYLTDLPNNNSGLDITKLVPSPGDPGFADGHAPLALAYNPVTNGRTPLVIAVSYDNGETWTDQLTIAEASDAVIRATKRQLRLSTDGLTRVEIPGEYSYPAIIATADGIAITYTYDRKHIQFARLSLEHLRSQGDIEVAPGVGHHESRDWLQWLTRD